MMGNHNLGYRDPLWATIEDLETELARLRRHLAAVLRYNEALEKQLEPRVIEEIRAELDAQDREAK
jgi:hypothetical protein